MEAKVLPFRRPNLVVFERFDVDDMAAFFRSKKGSDTYYFTLLSDGTLDEVIIRRDQEIVSDEDFTPAEREHAERLVREATTVLKDQLATWGTLGPSERLSLLVAWGEETIGQLKTAIVAAADDNAQEHSEEIALMCKDIENHEFYLEGLETARSLL